MFRYLLLTLRACFTDFGLSEINICFSTNKKNMMVPRARIELALPKKPDFESGASTNSATPAQAVKYIRFKFYRKRFFRFIAERMVVFRWLGAGKDESG